MAILGDITTYLDVNCRLYFKFSFINSTFFVNYAIPYITQKERLMCFLKTTSMSVKLTKSPAEYQSHTHGIQLNANKPLINNRILKDRETMGQYKVVNIKVLKQQVTSSSFCTFFIFKKNEKKNRCTAPVFGLSTCKRRMESNEWLLRYGPYKLMNNVSLYKKFHIF